MIQSVSSRVPPPGWYVDPADAAAVRWWDGLQWTTYTAARPTPRPAIAPRAPRKWLGAWGGLIIVGACVLLWLYLLLVSVLLLQSGVLQLVLFIGAFGMASAFVYTMCYRLKASDGIGPQLLVLIFLIGGFLAVLLPAIVEPLLHALFAALGDKQDVGSLIVVGPIEEGSKLLLVVLAARFISVKTVRNGLFLGGAIGFGFSAFENLDYGLGAWLRQAPTDSAHVVNLLVIVIARALTGPFAHPIWTSLLAAALFATYRDGRFHLTWRLGGIFVLVAGAHSLWDLAFPVSNQLLGDSGLAVLLGWGAIIGIVVAGALIWRTVSKRANRAAALLAAHDASLGA